VNKFNIIVFLFSCESRDNHDEYLPDVAKVQAVGKYGFIEDGLMVENGTIKSGGISNAMVAQGFTATLSQRTSHRRKER
jgi:hypothetical protein